eukprot:TRINITY_DN16482_c0_g1_i1.p1 TRINITY_DN16482_c0_g1~~TRINITY_DN16482_c0_g1_i1.p1  ORF type:complete len:255 (+),score=94.53 TRINITY_DN16482_c0_g1_i1:82-765(+)
MGQDDSKLCKETGLDKDDIQKLRDKYQMLCKDEHGAGPVKKLTKQQFRSHFPSTGQEQADLVFELFDSHHTGAINFREFCMAMSVLLRGSKEQRLRFCFDMWDTHHTGYITPEDFKAVLSTFHRTLNKLLASAVADTRTEMSTEQRHLTQAQVDAAAQKLFKEADQRGLGKVTFDEFRAFAERHPDIFDTLDVVLRQVKSASFWDWTVPSGKNERRPSMFSDACSVM